MYKNVDIIIIYIGPKLESSQVLSSLEQINYVARMW
jgi:hypothetical protein